MQSVYNVTGNMVRKIRDINDTTYTFSLIGMPAGLYLVRVMGDKFSVARTIDSKEVR